MRGVVEGARGAKTLIVEEIAALPAGVDVAGGRSFAAGAMGLGNLVHLVEGQGVVVAEMLRLHYSFLTFSLLWGQLECV